MPNPAPYWQKNGDELKCAEDLAWNFPEQKRGLMSIIGGNSNNFSTEVKIAEYLNKSFPFFQLVENHFPDSLKTKLPPIPSLKFYASTDQGSFASSNEFTHCLDESSAAIFAGDFTKNSVTSIAVAKLIKSNPSIPIVLARDSIDLVQNEANTFIERDNLFIVASLAQIQKLFRALYYPRPIMLSLPVLPVVEALHKFTLSYPVSLLTFHEGKIICANNGKIVSVDLNKTDFSPISLWSGNLAAALATFSVFNLSQPLEAMVAAINYKPTNK